MTKAELIDDIAARRNLSRGTAEQVVNLIFDGLRDALRRGERVEIRGFGSFKVRRYDGYEGRNPKTGEVIQVLPKALPVFKPGKDLKERVNGGPL